MMKAVIFGTKEATEKFTPYYDTATKRGDFKIIARAVFDPKSNRFVIDRVDRGGCLILSTLR